MPRRVNKAVEPPADDPHIEWLATALIQALDAQGIPLVAVHRLLPDIVKRIDQEARDRAARHLAEIDARRRAWAQELGPWMLQLLQISSISTVDRSRLPSG
jgi:hypothetical protein